MQVRISKPPATIERTEILVATKWFATKLFDASLLPDIKVNIKFIPAFAEIVDGKMTAVNAMARITCLDFDTANRFVIEIDNRLKRYDILRCLAHELAHAKQFAYGELSYKYNHAERRSIAVYRNVEYDDYDVDTDEYWFLPWEIEAYGYEHSLMRVYNKRKR